MPNNAKQFHKLLAILALDAQCNETEAYDGWSDEEMLAFFVQQYHFNPITARTELLTEIVVEFCNFELQQQLKGVKVATQDEYLQKLQELGIALTTTEFHTDLAINALIHKCVVLYTVKG